MDRIEPFCPLCHTDGRKKWGKSKKLWFPIRLCVTYEWHVGLAARMIKMDTEKKVLDPKAYAFYAAAYYIIAAKLSVYNEDADKNTDEFMYSEERERLERIIDQINLLQSQKLELHDTTKSIKSSNFTFVVVAIVVVFLLLMLIINR